METYDCMSEEGLPRPGSTTSAFASGLSLAHLWLGNGYSKVSSLIRPLPILLCSWRLPSLRDLYLCVPKRKAPTRELYHKNLPPGTLRLMPDWATILWKAHLQSVNCHLKVLLWLRNYRPEGSSPTEQLPKSIPIRQLSSERFIRD